MAYLSVYWGFSAVESDKWPEFANMCLAYHVVALLLDSRYHFLLQSYCPSYR
jgi:hypothetical protein